MKRALLVGIDSYDNFKPLKGCVNDVSALLPLLSRNEDDSPNFHCQAKTSSHLRIDRTDFLVAVDALLSPGSDIALLYFAGHGIETKNDVTLVTQDCKSSDTGVPLSVILGKIQQSKIAEIIVILDCCFSGGAGGVPQLGVEDAVLRSGVSFLTASRSDQVAAETAFGRGLFSAFLCGALQGGAADVLGKVTIASVYAYLSESFGPWDQRPTFKANVDRLHELRQCDPAVPLPELRRLPELFDEAESLLPLDPSYEPTMEPSHPEHEANFSILQKCRAAKLVEPFGAEHLYFAATESASCRLTALGKLYWKMAKDGRI